MNLALQKRHEQLERWRQNEANAELQEKQQATERTKLLHEKSQNISNNQSDYEKTKSHQNYNYKLNKATTVQQNNISPTYSDLVLDAGSGGGGERISSSDRKLRFASSKGSGSSTSLTRFSAGSKQQQAQQQHQHQQHQQHVKFTNDTLFLNACANGDLDECKRFLEERLVDINVTTCDGLTGLHEAAICGNCEMVEYLLDRGANINCCDNEGWTPLHAAASLGQTDIVKLLLERQADATIVNCENFLAYDLSRNDEVRELIGAQLEGHDIDQLRRQEELLIEQDIEKWIRTGHYEEKFHPVTQATVLHVLAAKGYTRLLKRILETPSLKKQINLEAKDHEGFTPLLAGSFWNQTDIVELLIEHGANIFAESNSGYKISSIHLKNYQQSKTNQPQPTRPSTTTTRATRLSSQSIDSDNASTTTDNQENNYSRAPTRSTTSLDSSTSAATSDDYNDSSIGDNIPSGSARHLRQQQQQQQGGPLSKSKSLDISSEYKTGQDGASQESPILFSTMSVDRLLLRADSMGERDLRKSFKELVMENERLKQQLKGYDDKDKQRQQDWIRKERQLHRKISELEEENKQIEHWKQEIQRLKDENNSLIRVNRI